MSKKDLGAKRFVWTVIQYMDYILFYILYIFYIYFLDLKMLGKTQRETREKTKKKHPWFHTTNTKEEKTREIN